MYTYVCVSVCTSDAAARDKKMKQKPRGLGTSGSAQKRANNVAPNTLDVRGPGPTVGRIKGQKQYWYTENDITGTKSP